MQQVRCATNHHVTPGINILPANEYSLIIAYRTDLVGHVNIHPVRQW